MNPGERARTDRVWFAHLARGLAAAIVVWYHLGETFLLRHEVVAQISLTDQLSPLPEPFYLTASRCIAGLGIELGYVGVALFFLISGFVIPFSLERLSNRAFYIRRAFRIYPLYWVSLALLLGLLLLQARSTGRSFPVSPFAAAANALLLNQYVGRGSVDHVNWTLAIEEIFYVVCSVTWRNGLLRRLGGTYVVAVASSALAVALAVVGTAVPTWLQAPILWFGHNTSFVPFLLIGTAFYQLRAKNWSVLQSAIFSATALALFFVSLRQSPHYKADPTTTVVSYSLALLMFLTLFAAEKRLPYNRALDRLAKISYPLYLVHGVIGYIALSYLCRSTQNHSVALAITVGLVVALAWLLHLVVEEPSQRIGKSLAKRATARAHAGSPAESLSSRAH